MTQNESYVSTHAFSKMRLKYVCYCHDILVTLVAVPLDECFCLQFYNRGYLYKLPGCMKDCCANLSETLRNVLEISADQLENLKISKSRIFSFTENKMHFKCTLMKCSAKIAT